MSHSSGPGDLQLADYTGVLRRRWWLILAVVMIGTLGSAGYFKTAHKTYTATASVYVTATSVTANQVAGGRTSGSVNLDTEAQVVQSTTVAQAAAKLMHSSESVQQLIKQVTVAVPPNSQVLTISCEAGSPVGSALCAQSFAQAYLNFSSSSTTAALNSEIAAVQSRVSTLQANSAKLTSQVQVLPDNSTQRATAQEQLNTDHNELTLLNSQMAGMIAELANPSGGSIISDATPPAKATSPKAALIVGSGLLASVLIGLILAFLVDRRDRRIRGPREMAQLDVPVLMSLPLKRSRPRLEITASRSPASRDFAELAHVLTGSLGDGRHVILIANAARGKGGSYVAGNLAIAMARNQPDVTLVCADLEESVIAGLAGLPEGPGLTEILAGTLDSRDAGQHPAMAQRLTVITPGENSAAADDLRQDTLETLIEDIRSRARYVIVEAPPIGSGPDVFTLAQVADATVLVVEVPRTRSDDVAGATQQLDRMGAAVLGAVLLPSPAPASKPSSVPASTPEDKASREHKAATSHAAGYEWLNDSPGSSDQSAKEADEDAGVPSAAVEAWAADIDDEDATRPFLRR